MALVNPNIAMSVRPLEIPQRNAMAEAAQVMNLQQAQMQMEKLRQTDEAMERIRQAAVKNGGPGDLNEIAQAFLQSPDLGHQQLGLKIRQQQQEKADFEKTARALGYSDLFPAAPSTATPSAAPMTPAQPGALGSGTFGIAPAPTANALAPAPTAPANQLTPAAPVPAAPVANALVSQEKTPEQLRREIMLFGRSNDPSAKNMVDMLKAQLTEAMKTTTVSPGQEVFRGGKVVYSREPTASEFERLLDASNLTDAEKMGLRRQRALKEATHAPPATATATIAAEKTEHVKRAEYLAKEYDDISRAAKLAAKSLPAIEMNLAILDKGFKTGFGEETKIAGARILGALGVKDAENMATDAQVFKANATQAILQKQLEQKGPQTESDAQRISEIGSQIPKTEDANRVLLAIGQAQLKRDMSQRAFFDKWWREHKTYDGAEDAWYAGEGGRSLFDSPEIKKQLAKTSIATPTTSAAPAAAPSSIRSQADAILRGGKP